MISHTFQEKDSVAKNNPDLHFNRSVVSKMCYTEIKGNMFKVKVSRNPNLMCSQGIVS